MPIVLFSWERYFQLFLIDSNATGKPLTIQHKQMIIGEYMHPMNSYIMANYMASSSNIINGLAINYIISHHHVN